MKLRTKYLLFIISLHVVTLVLSFVIFRDHKLLFIISEALVLLSIWLAWGLYKELIGPLNTLAAGVEAIQDRDFSVKFRPTGKYEVDKLIGVYNSMIDQLREERTRQEQQHFFLEKLIATAPTGIIVLDFDNHIEQVNPRAEAILQLNEQSLKGRFVSDVQHPLLQQIATVATGESRTVSINGINTYKLQVAHFIDRGFPRRFITVEELTAEILAAEKKVYGRVIRMMAHEVNNTVGPVNTILQSALTGDRSNQARSEALQHAFGVAIGRSNNLNQFMRHFADLVKLPPPARKKLDLHQVLYNISTLLAMRAQEQAVQFVFKLDGTTFFIEADEQQLEQALINIVKNALEAIGSNGTVTFETNQAKAWVRIVDSGKGISEAEADHLFSPFFTTKRDGQGIGLMLVRDILRNHGFQFSLKTEAPQTTVFTIVFELPR